LRRGKKTTPWQPRVLLQEGTIEEKNIRILRIKGTSSDRVGGKKKWSTLSKRRDVCYENVKCRERNKGHNGKEVLWGGPALFQKAHTKNLRNREGEKKVLHTDEKLALGNPILRQACATLFLRCARGRDSSLGKPPSQKLHGESLGSCKGRGRFFCI